MRVIGIETSCDETGIALYQGGRGLIAHALHSQIPLHARHGGVVPEIASRDHVRKVMPLLKGVLEEGGCTLKDIHGIAYTAGPGLMGALMVGAAFGRSLAFGLGIPSIGVHHMEAHLLAPMLEENPPSFPFLALLVSGGHTLLVAVEGVGRYRVIGESLDDAAGEAFDKVAKMLGLGYPGGPAIARLAEQGTPGRFHFPRPLTQRAGLDFSFSGLKTHVMRAVQAAGAGAEADIAHAFQEAVVETLAIKCGRALEATGLERLVVAGGVGANRRLRERLALLGVPVFYPRPAFCTDNGAMVAYAGYLRLRAGERDGPGFSVRARWPLEDLSPVPG